MAAVQGQAGYAGSLGIFISRKGHKDRCQMSEVGGQRTELRGQMSEVGGQRTEVRGQRTDDRNFRVGDRVACTGSGYASHAEMVVVPPNLCARIPDNVSFEDAAYGALGGIAMEAVRLARVEFGHRVAVIGLGLLGQLATQILSSITCFLPISGTSLI